MKIPGHCSISGEPCFDVVSTFPEDHPFAGQPKRLGQPHPDALRVTLIMASGTNMQITVKECELTELHTHLPEMWRNIKARLRAERKAHKALKQPDFSDDQHQFMDEENIRFNDNIPLGVLCWERWTDYAE